MVIVEAGLTYAPKSVEAQKLYARGDIIFPRWFLAEKVRAQILLAVVR